MADDYAIDLEESVGLHNKKSARGYDIAFSFGKVTIDADGHANVSDLMVEADALMYEQKKNKDA